MKYELPEFPTEGRFTVVVPADYGESFDAWTEKGVRQYAEQAVAPLLAEIERLEKVQKRYVFLRNFGCTKDFPIHFWMDSELDTAIDMEMKK